MKLVAGNSSKGFPYFLGITASSFLGAAGFFSSFFLGAFTSFYLGAFLVAIVATGSAFYYKATNSYPSIYHSFLAKRNFPKY